MSTGKLVSIAKKYGRIIEDDVVHEKIEDIMSDPASMVASKSDLEKINTSLENKANKEHTHEPQINCDTVDNLHFVCLTKSEYDALETKDSNTLYFIKKEGE